MLDKTKLDDHQDTYEDIFGKDRDMEDAEEPKTTGVPPIQELKLFATAISKSYHVKKVIIEYTFKLNGGEIHQENKRNILMVMACFFSKVNKVKRDKNRQKMFTKMLLKTSYNHTGHLQGP